MIYIFSLFEEKQKFWLSFIVFNIMDMLFIKTVLSKGLNYEKVTKNSIFMNRKNYVF